MMEEVMSMIVEEVEEEEVVVVVVVAMSRSRKSRSRKKAFGSPPSRCWPKGRPR